MSGCYVGNLPVDARTGTDSVRGRARPGRIIVVVVVVVVGPTVAEGECGPVSEAAGPCVVRWPVAGKKLGLLDRKAASPQPQLAQVESYSVALLSKSGQASLDQSDRQGTCRQTRRQLELATAERVATVDRAVAAVVEVEVVAVAVVVVVVVEEVEVVVAVAVVVVAAVEAASLISGEESSPGDQSA